MADEPPTEEVAAVPEPDAPAADGEKSDAPAPAPEAAPAPEVADDEDEDDAPAEPPVEEEEQWDIYKLSCVDGPHVNHNGVILGACTNPEGNRYCSAGGDGKVTMWDAKSFTVKSEFKGHTDAVTTCAFYHDVKFMRFDTVFSAGYDETIRVYDVVHSKCTAVFQGHTNWITGLLVIGENLVSCSADGTCRFYDLTIADLPPEDQWEMKGIPPDALPPTYDYLGSVRAHPGGITTMVKVPDHNANTPPGTFWNGCIEDLFVTAGKDGTIVVWSANLRIPLIRLKNAPPEGHDAGTPLPPPITVRAMCTAFESNGERSLYVSYENCTVLKLDLKALIESWSKSGFTEGGKPTELVIQNFLVEKLVFDKKSHSQMVLSMVFGHDCLFTAGADMMICIWKPDEEKENKMEVQQRLVGHEDWIRTMTVLPKAGHDGLPRMASTAHDGSVRVWEMPKNKEF